MLRIHIDCTGPAPQELYVPRVSPQHPIPVSRPDSLISRAELLGYLTFEQFCALLVRRNLSERQKYARWCVRRVLSVFETVRRTDGRIFHLSRGGHMRATSGWTDGKHSTSSGTLLVDGRLMRDLPEVLLRYGCPSEHFESAQRLIRARLTMKWGA